MMVFSRQLTRRGLPLCRGRGGIWADTETGHHLLRPRIKHHWCHHRQHGIPAPRPQRLSNPSAVTGLGRVRENSHGVVVGGARADRERHCHPGQKPNARHRCDLALRGLAFMPMSGVCCDSVTSSRLFCLWRRGRRMECCPVTDDSLPLVCCPFPMCLSPRMGQIDPSLSWSRDGIGTFITS